MSSAQADALVAKPEPLLEEQIAVGSPERLRLIGIEVFWWRHITPGSVTLHLSAQAPHVVLGVSEMHQLPLVRGFKDGVANLLTVGEQAQAPLALG